MRHPLAARRRRLSRWGPAGRRGRAVPATSPGDPAEQRSHDTGQSTEIAGQASEIWVPNALVQEGRSPPGDDAQLDCMRCLDLGEDHSEPGLYGQVATVRVAWCVGLVPYGGAGIVDDDVAPVEHRQPPRLVLGGRQRFVERDLAPQGASNGGVAVRQPPGPGFGGVGALSLDLRRTLTELVALRSEVWTPGTGDLGLVEVAAQGLQPGP